VDAAHSVDPDRWQEAFGAVIDRLAPRFARYEPVRHAADLILGRLSGLDRKNCWTIAEHRGDASPDGLQHLLARASWDADAVRDDVRGYVIDAFGDEGAVLVVDETGDVKKGDQSVVVQRQYTGTAGRIENAQVAVSSPTRPSGGTLIDRALYLPRSWTDDTGRWVAAGVPADVEFATKAALATAVVLRAVPPPSNAITRPAPAGLIPLTVNEFRRLFDALLLAGKRSITALLAWSRWRRRHQARAGDCHYRRREHQLQ
jgi:SRSO17 transposase